VKGRDVASGAVWLLIGAFVAWSGWDLELGAVNDPGSGFMLFWVGLVMIVLSLAVVLPALRPVTVPAAALWGGTRWSRVGYVLVALIVYAWLLPRLGFLLTTALVMLFLFKVVEPQRWWVAVAGAVLSALIAYVVFKVWLGAQLPAGVFEIG
jgi:putative tricarboxylic transport membrane protein